MSDDLDSVSFNKNYKVLKDTADWLSQQKESDIDQLVPAGRAGHASIPALQGPARQGKGNPGATPPDRIGSRNSAKAETDGAATVSIHRSVQPSEDGEEDLPFPEGRGRIKAKRRVLRDDRSLPPPARSSTRSAGPISTP